MCISAQCNRAGSALRVHDLLQQNPHVTAPLLVGRTDLLAPTIDAALADLEPLGIVQDSKGRTRGRVFGYRCYLAIPRKLTDPLPAVT